MAVRTNGKVLSVITAHLWWLPLWNLYRQSFHSVGQCPMEEGSKSTAKKPVSIHKLFIAFRLVSSASFISGGGGGTDP